MAPTTPQDHLATREAQFDAELERDELLEGLPEVKQPHRLRIKEQNSVIRLAFELDELLDKHKAPDYTTMTLEQLHAIALERKIVIDDAATVEQLAALLGPKDYSSMSKPELAALAAERGLEVTAKASKPDLVKALEGSEPRTAEDNRALMEMLVAAEQIDEWAESTIAIDVQAYTEWAEGKTHEVFFALLTRYASALGK